MESLKKQRKGKCALCNCEATSTCSKCKSTHYCSRNCQKSDWKNHKKTCNPVLGQIQTPVVESPLLAEIIENLPLDILAMIFKKLSSLKDIVSCYKTCVRWKQTIEKLFENKCMYVFLSSIIMPDQITCISHGHDIMINSHFLICNEVPNNF